jgi:adenylylsulfate kinase
MNGVVVWITGLPGSGKSTIADALKERHPGFVILRMDDLRKVATPSPSYSEEEREILYRSCIYMAKTLSGLGHSVIIDATGNRRRWRALARRILPRYIEIYLRCSVEECSARERSRGNTRGAPRDIYRKGQEGWPVPGVNVPYEEPVSPELAIDSDAVSVEKTVELIEEVLPQF